MDGYPHPQQQQQHSYTAAPSFPPPIRAGQKRAAEYDLDSPHHLRTPPQPPSGALPGLAAGGTGALQDSRATSSSAESTPGDAAAALVKEEDGANASASGSGKKVKGGNNPPPLKRGSACTLCRKRKLYGDPAQERIAEKHKELEDRIRSLEAELEYYRAGGSSAPSTAPGNNSAATPYSPFSANTSAAQPPEVGAYLDPALHAPTDAYGVPLGQQQPQQPCSAVAPNFSQYPTQQLPIESPYLYAGSIGQLQQPSPVANPFARRDSEAFPLPPANAQQQAHLQSFPFAMNPTPQLADLINPPTATSQAHVSPGTATTPITPPLNGAASAYGPEAIAPAWGTELPPLELMLELAELYFLTLHAHLPFLHRRRFLFTLHHPASLASPPSQSLIFSVLALAAAYHDSPIVQAQGPVWYALARQKVDIAISAGLHHPAAGAHGSAGGPPKRVATLTVEMVQALCLLSLIEMGQSDHQRAFLSMGQAVRIAAMLGLHRMDEDRVAMRTGVMREKRLRPPALHPLPSDPVLLEECRRTMCAVYVLDRFESACVGWPAAIAEADVRVLLPCADDLFELGTCDADGRDNPLWWPADEAGTSAEKGWKGIMAEEEANKRGASPKRNGAAQHLDDDAGVIGTGVGGEADMPPRVGTFAWLCRVVWLGGRLQAETYRASGPPAGGPWNKHVSDDPLDSVTESLEMDNVLDWIRSKFVAQATQQQVQGNKSVNGPILLILLIVNCMFVNLHHLRASTGLSVLPWDPSGPIYVGSSEYAMQRCWVAIHSLHTILAQLSLAENSRTTLRHSRANPYTALVPYALYTIAFPSKFAVGDWSVLVASRDRSESIQAHIAREMPSGDDAFPPSFLNERLAFVDVACDAMDRIGDVWPVGKKFAAMVRGDRDRLAARYYERASATAAPPPPPAPPSHPSSSNPNTSPGQGPSVALYSPAGNAGPAVYH
ncbi:hypothetical protein Rhopal_005532-T1 [Rhodotorula paludigena]|uniref:Xylanolytic transcriptional activator regulatory domain-containing protein n=1 Tax=Rhodotorula paludigena TaxID=86838 RepID=A0AAV5GT10_9BASI|nr:hypothetical protein Rhopal_005532-T1 [Rhodotorula paludigena]